MKKLGRKPKPIIDRRVTLSTRVLPLTRKKLEELRKKEKKSFGQIIDLFF